MERQAKYPTTKGSADWFTGDVYVDPIAHSRRVPAAGIRQRCPCPGTD